MVGALEEQAQRAATPTHSGVGLVLLFAPKRVHMSEHDESSSFDIFTSYSRDDSKLVREVIDYLAGFGLRIWFDRQSMVYGKQIHESLHEGIQSSSVILIFVSHNSVGSHWVLEELDTAMALEKKRSATVVPIFLGRIPDEKVPEAIRDKYSLDLRYNFQKRWLEAREAFTDTIMALAKGEAIVPRAIVRPREAMQDSAVGPSFSATEVARLYGFPPDLDGTGQCVGLVELGGGYQEADLQAYVTGLNLPPPTVTSVSVDGARNSPGGAASVQVTMDLEVVAAIAPRADIVVYFAPPTERGFVDAILTAAADDTHNPGVLCMGWGQPEPAWTQDSVARINEALAAAAARGITVCCAAGDKGPTDGVADGEAHVDFPASSPHVLACGGTQLTAKGSRIETEIVWNNYPDGGVTGGGFSENFPAPEWQEGIFTPDFIKPGKPGGRGLPDVAANASPSTGYHVLVDGKATVVGGTSAAAPLWAGLITLMNQGLGERVGFLNPVLYQNLGPAGVLSDITQGSTRQGEQANLGYQARAGWDPCTGWGVPNGERLLGALKVLQTTTRSERRKPAS
jgi:TIR domain/Subtilase family